MPGTTETTRLETVAPKSREARAKKSFFGRLLERTGKWIKPIGNAKLSAKELIRDPEWEGTTHLDLSEQEKLPHDFKAPIQVEKIRFNYNADQKDGIATQVALVTSLPAEKTIKAEFVISTQQIYNILQNDPTKLTPEMARLIVGNKVGVEGLSPKAIYNSLVRIERKFPTKQIDQIDSEVKNILLDKLKRSGDQKLWNNTLKLSNFLQFSNSQELAIITDQKQAGQKETDIVKQRELKAIKKDLSRPNELAELAGKKFNTDNVAKYFLEQNLEIIKARIKNPISTRPDLLRASLEQGYKTILRQEGITDQALVKALTKAALMSLRRLENAFEYGGSKASKNYKRITSQNEGSREKLIYATALMKRDTGIVTDSKRVKIEQLEN